MNILSSFSLATVFLFSFQAFGVEGYLQSTIDGEQVKIEFCNEDQCEVLGPVEWNLVADLKRFRRNQYIDGTLKSLLGAAAIGVGFKAASAGVGLGIMVTGANVVFVGASQIQEGRIISKVLKDNGEDFSREELVELSRILITINSDELFVAEDTLLLD